MNMNGYRFDTPPVVKNLIIANCVMLLATTLLPFRDELIGRLALFNPASPLFHTYQVFTYMFLHGGVGHLFFNMFALWMFGRTLEYRLGSRRFFFRRALSQPDHHVDIPSRGHESQVVRVALRSGGALFRIVGLPVGRGALRPFGRHAVGLGVAALVETFG